MRRVASYSAAVNHKRPRASRKVADRISEHAASVRRFLWGNRRVPLQFVEPRRLYRQIADQIAGLIAAGEFLPGSRLPAERELAAKLGVSRASVREAIISLEIGGLVEVRVGTEIFVTARGGRGTDADDRGVAPGDGAVPSWASRRASCPGACRALTSAANSNEA